MKIQKSLALITSFMILSCGVEEDTQFDPKDIRVPDARPINLASSQDGLQLQGDESDCSQFQDLGVFGIPLGLACHTTPFVGQMLYGDDPDRDQDGELTCADYDREVENGILVSLLCERGLANYESITSMRFQDEDQNDVAISFLDYDATDAFDAVGNWSIRRDAEANFPSNIRIWTGDSVSDPLSGVFAAQLDSPTKGTIFFDFTAQGVPLAGEVRFIHQEDTSQCSASPSADTCHVQEIKLKGLEEGGSDNPPPGMHLRILASSKVDPEFFLIEGSMRMTEESANAAWENDPVVEQLPDLLGIRDIYFRTVKKDDSLWGSFDLKDGDDQTLPLEVSPINGVTVSFGSILRDGPSGDDYSGICQEMGSDEQITCTSLTYTDYESLWIGDDSVNALTSDYVIPVDMNDIPQEYGVFP